MAHVGARGGEVRGAVALMVPNGSRTTEDLRSWSPYVMGPGFSQNAEADPHAVRASIEGDLPCAIRASLSIKARGCSRKSARLLAVVVIVAALVTGLGGARSALAATCFTLAPTGNDVILGSSGNDTISGNGGNDDVEGGNSDDTVGGGAGTGDLCHDDDGTDRYSDGSLAASGCETVVGIP